MINLKDLLPKVKDLMNKLIVECKKQGIDICITQGVRTIDEQNKLYAQGRTIKGMIVTNAKGGESFHNYGVAFDFAILENGKIDWNVRNKNWQIVGLIGEKLGLCWGGRWKGFVDLPHMQFCGKYSLKDFQQGKIDLSKFA